MCYVWGMVFYCINWFISVPNFSRSLERKVIDGVRVPSYFRSVPYGVFVAVANCLWLMPAAVLICFIFSLMVIVNLIAFLSNNPCFYISPQSETGRIATPEHGSL